MSEAVKIIGFCVFLFLVLRTVRSYQYWGVLKRSAAHLERRVSYCCPLKVDHEAYLSVKREQALKDRLSQISSEAKKMREAVELLRSDQEQHRIQSQKLRDELDGWKKRAFDALDHWGRGMLK